MASSKTLGAAKSSSKKQKCSSNPTVSDNFLVIRQFLDTAAVEFRLYRDAGSATDFVTFIETCSASKI